MSANKTTGRKGQAFINGNKIDITAWTAKPRKELADSTDSGDFDPPSGQLYTSQQPGAVGQDITIEGNYDLTKTSPNFTQQLKQDPPADVVLWLTDTVKHSEGHYDLEDCETKLEVPGGTMVKFTCNGKSNGVVTHF